MTYSTQHKKVLEYTPTRKRNKHNYARTYKHDKHSLAIQSAKYTEPM